MHISASSDLDLVRVQLIEGFQVALWARRLIIVVLLVLILVIIINDIGLLSALWRLNITNVNIPATFRLKVFLECPGA